MSQNYINQITLDCLLNRVFLESNEMKQREKQIENDDLIFYEKRILNLFQEILSKKLPVNLSPDVKYSFDTFIKSSIHYFKMSDSNDLMQAEYNDIDSSLDTCINDEPINCEDADKLLMRSVTMTLPTLDKYVKRTLIKKEPNIILPKTREVDIKNPELINKGLKKNNINNLYEDNSSK
jgi:hypothetical protein